MNKITKEEMKEAINLHGEAINSKGIYPSHLLYKKLKIGRDKALLVKIADEYDNKGIVYYLFTEHKGETSMLLLDTNMKIIDFDGEMEGEDK